MSRCRHDPQHGLIGRHVRRRRDVCFRDAHGCLRDIVADGHSTVSEGGTELTELGWIETAKAHELRFAECLRCWPHDVGDSATAIFWGQPPQVGEPQI